MKSNKAFLRSYLVILMAILLPVAGYVRTAAVSPSGTWNNITFQDDRKKEGKKKPDVKEVPKSKKQSKPGKPRKD